MSNPAGRSSFLWPAENDSRWASEDLDVYNAAPRRHLQESSVQTTREVNNMRKRDVSPSSIIQSIENSQVKRSRVELAASNTSGVEVINLLSDDERDGPPTQSQARTAKAKKVFKPDTLMMDHTRTIVVKRKDLHMIGYESTPQGRMKQVEYTPPRTYERPSMLCKPFVQNQDETPADLQKPKRKLGGSLFGPVPSIFDEEESDSYESQPLHTSEAGTTSQTVHETARNAQRDAAEFAEAKLQSKRMREEARGRKFFEPNTTLESQGAVAPRRIDYNSISKVCQPQQKSSARPIDKYQPELSSEEQVWRLHRYGSGSVDDHQIARRPGPKDYRGLPLAPRRPRVLSNKPRKKQHVAVNGHQGTSASRDDKGADSPAAAPNSNTPEVQLIESDEDVGTEGRSSRPTIASRTLKELPTGNPTHVFNDLLSTVGVDKTIDGTVVLERAIVEDCEKAQAQRRQAANNFSTDSAATSNASYDAPLPQPKRRSILENPPNPDVGVGDGRSSFERQRDKRIRLQRERNARNRASTPEEERSPAAQQLPQTPYVWQQGARTSPAVQGSVDEQPTEQQQHVDKQSGLPQIGDTSNSAESTRTRSINVGSLPQPPNTVTNASQVPAPSDRTALVHPPKQNGISIKDVWVWRWRTEGLKWSDVVTNYRNLYDFNRSSEDTLRGRFRAVEAARAHHDVNLELLERVLNGEEDALQELNDKVPPAPQNPVIIKPRDKAGHFVSDKAPEKAQANNRKEANSEVERISRTVPIQNAEGGSDEDPPELVLYRPQGGGKTVTTETFLHMMGAASKSLWQYERDGEEDALGVEDPEEQDSDAGEDSNTGEKLAEEGDDDDYVHFTYQVQRRLFTQEEVEQEDFEPNQRPYGWVDCGEQYETLAEATAQAGLVLGSSTRGSDAPGKKSSVEFNPDQDGLPCTTFRHPDHGWVQVRVVRGMRSHHDAIKPVSRFSWAPKTIWFVKLQVMVLDGTDWIIEDLATESDIYTTLELANLRAVDLFVKKTVLFAGNLDRHEAEQGSARMRLREEFGITDEAGEGGEERAFEKDEEILTLRKGDRIKQRVKVWVAQGKLNGPRNL